MLAPHNTHPWFFLHKTWCQFCSTVNMLAYTYLAMQLEFGWKNQTWISNINHFKWIAGDDGIGKISLEYHGDSIQSIPMIFQWNIPMISWYYHTIWLYPYEYHDRNNMALSWFLPGLGSPKSGTKSHAGRRSRCNLLGSMRSSCRRRKFVGRRPQKRHCLIVRPKSKRWKMHWKTRVVPECIRHHHQVSSTIKLQSR